MREFALLTSNYVLFALLTAIVASLQSSLWLQLFGYFPAPYLWLAILNYWVMFRSPTKAVVMTYIAAYVLFSMTGMPLNMVFAVLLVNFGFLYFLKDRVLWAGPTQFMLACAASALHLPLTVGICSIFLETSTSVHFNFFDWIMSCLLTALFSLPFYHVFVLLDRFTQQGAPKDTSSEII